jgi:hypothetical protein
MTNPEPTSRSNRPLWRKRLPWASLAAVLCGCVAVCGLPVLAALGIGGGAATAVAHLVRPGTEVAVAGVALLAAVVFFAVRLRARRRAPAGAACGDACRLARALGPGSDDAAGGDATGGGRLTFFSRPAVPAAAIVCTGDRTLARLQIDGYRAAFEHLISVDAIPRGFRWTFRAQLGLASQLRGLAEREAGCCRFLSFDLTSEGDRIVWESTGDASATSVIDEIARLPQRLRDEPRAEHDIAVLKQNAEAAGLAFRAMDAGDAASTAPRRQATAPP